MDKTAHIQLGIIYHNDIDPSLPLQDTKYYHPACRTTSSSTLVLATKIAFIQFSSSVKNLIGSATGGDFEHKNSNSFFCIFILSLQLVIYILHT